MRKFLVRLVMVLTVVPAGFAEESPVLLITSAELKKAWEPFAAWKAKQGKKTVIVTTDEIGRSEEGGDLPDKIRRRVRRGIEDEGVRWVILGGDSEPGGEGVVPDRDTFHRTMWGTVKDIPTDIYYLSDGNWDADGDGVYGEWEDDREAIDYPDGTVGLGRIPVRTRADVAAYTAKVMAYEREAQEVGYATTFTISCPVDGAVPKLRSSWREVISPAWGEGEVQWFLSKGEKRKPTKAEWLELINGGTSGKIHMHGHGLLECWVMEGDEMLKVGDLKGLTNRNAYPVITTVSCFTGHYDAAKDPSIAESLLRLADAGAVLVVCPSREGKPHFLDPKKDFPLMISEGKRDGTTATMAEFWKAGLGAERKSAGEALMAVKAAMVADARKSASFHLCLCELNLLGDPTLGLGP